MTKIAALQQDAVPGDVAANLTMCQRLADAAAAGGGAEIIVLPEFFSTGMGFLPELLDCALPPQGPATELLCRLARRHQVIVGGSFLCRDRDGEIRNAFLLATPQGIAGRHDKDLPTMWENCFYVGGNDDGVLPRTGGFRPGAALCWEFMRTGTVQRMRGRVDLVLGGSCWWSIPPWPPRALTRRWENANAATAAGVASAFARLVGAPVAHAAHCGQINCRVPMTPIPYRGHAEGGAVIAAADGRVLARRDRCQGPGYALADVAVAAVTPAEQPPPGFWLHPRGALPAACWTYQNWHGRRWYARHQRRGTTGAATSGSADHAAPPR